MGSAFDYRIYEGDDKKSIRADWIHDKSIIEEEYPGEYISDNYDEDDEDFHYDEALAEAEEDLAYSGQINTLDDNIDWININPFDSENAAVDYIEKHHEKWQPPLAVPFKDGDKLCYAIGGWCSD